MNRLRLQPMKTTNIAGARHQIQNESNRMRPLRLKSIDCNVRIDTKQRFVGVVAAQIKNKPVCRRLFREGSGLDGASGEGTSL